MDNKKTVSSDLAKFVTILIDSYKSIVIITFIGAALSIFLSLQIPNKYKSDAKIVASTEDNKGGLGAIAGQFGGLANMAGISLGGKSDVNLLMDTLKSRNFLKSFIEKEDIKVEIFAVEGWDMSSNELLFNPEIYDIDSKKWVRKPEGLRQSEPSLEETYTKFSEMINVARNKKTDLLTVSLTFYSPEISKLWLEKLLEHLSEYLREQDKLEAQKSLDYLSNNRKEIAISELRVVFAELLREQHQKLMLANVKSIYGYEIRDSAYMPEEKASPKRAIIVIVSTFFAFVLSIAFVFIRKFIGIVKNA
ncbi:GNVR domain-containing protein [Pseudoalteromonas sp. T1lg24]|uniref:GNVR domain-containing protein n=1 Tax=Pseudoalteromonas sp. T1lg24 TaxID=2077099 RepID=UPI000CF62D24|nr:GNVR domain-containing protein [Pseudoalteromonas sp. T1lg24]